MSTPRFTKEFSDYVSADAWITEGCYRESIISIDITGETTVTLEGDFALRAIDKERPLATGGFRIIPIERYG